MEIDKQKILERIVKLMTLSNSDCFSEEGKTAMLMARKLMRKYRIDESQLQMEADDSGIRILSKRGSVTQWEINLSGVIADALDCRCFVHGGIHFIGVESDVESCAFLFGMIGHFLHIRSAGTSDKETYHLAALTVINQRLRDIFQPGTIHVEERALVVHKKSLVDDAFDKIAEELDLEQNQKPASPESREAWMKGMKEGASAPMHEMVHGD